MKQGHVRDNFPRLVLSLPGRDGQVNIEFIVDTGYDGELTLPHHVLDDLEAVYVGDRPLLLADGSPRRQPFYQLETDWDDEPRSVEVVVLGGSPLVGVELLSGSLLQIEMTDGGEVLIEPL